MRVTNGGPGNFKLMFRWKIFIANELPPKWKRVKTTTLYQEALSELSKQRSSNKFVALIYERLSGEDKKETRDNFVEKSRKSK